jgi:hypothetical protein
METDKGIDMTMIADPSATISKLTTVIERAASDPAYRSALIQSTKATLESAGISIPAGLTVKVAQNTDKIRNLVLYAKPSLSGEDAQQLAAMLSQASAPKGQLDAYAKLTIDSWSDSQLHARLRTDATSVLKQYGISLAAGGGITQLEASEALAWLVVPTTTTNTTTDPSGALEDVAASITTTFGNLPELLTASSYAAGLGFAIGGTLKFKQQQDNPTQIPIATPIALLYVAAALIFLPTTFGKSA